MEKIIMSRKEYEKALNSAIIIAKKGEIPVPFEEDLRHIDFTENIKQYIPWLIYLCGKVDGHYICQSESPELPKVRKTLTPLLNFVVIE